MRPIATVRSLLWGLGHQSGNRRQPGSVERTGEPRTGAHLVACAGGSSRRSEEAILARSLAGSRGRRMVLPRMSSRGRRMVLPRMSSCGRRMVLLRMSYSANAARLLATSPQCDAMTRSRTAARGGLWYPEPGCMLLFAGDRPNGLLGAELSKTVRAMVGWRCPP